MELMGSVTWLTEHNAERVGDSRHRTKVTRRGSKRVFYGGPSKRGPAGVCAFGKSVAATDPKYNA